MGRISIGEEDGNIGEEIQDYDNGGGEEYQVLGNFIHLWIEARPTSSGRWGLGIPGVWRRQEGGGRTFVHRAFVQGSPLYCCQSSLF